MPHMGGIDCAAAIAAEWPNHGVPIIAVTADAFEESRQRCMDSGFAGWLSKPFRVDGMMTVLAQVLAAKLAGAAAAAVAGVN
jgi:CheY-like chemotaxis protein